jgi:NADPH:quinone reductase-like Zn-dependent oxidoreductase
MKAVVQDRYGPPEVLRIEEVERPVPKDDEVLIRVRASTVTQTDTHARRADLFLWRLVFGLRRPRSRTLGVELAGEFRAAVDRRYPIDQAVEAHRYVEAWHKAGNVVLTIATD